MNANARSTKTLCVVGAGNMGSGIAQKMATEGFEVIVLDLSEGQVAKGLAGIDKTLSEGVERKVFKPDQAKAIRGRIRGTTRWEDLADVDLLVEAVFEDLDVKQSVFAKAEAHTRPDTILATNTSSFLVTDVALGVKRRERVVGLHYFYHPAKNRLVEVIPGAETAPEVVERAWSLQEQLGKTPIASADASGFVVNRYFVPWLNEAVRLLDEGVADIATIEAAAKEAFGVGMGPFELMNVTGVPIAMHAANTLGRAFGPLYAPAPGLEAQVASGKPWPLEGSPDPSRFEEVAHRMQDATFFVACSLLDEEVGTLEDVDIGARVGLRWPKGPFEMMNRLGITPVAERVTAFGGRWDTVVPPILSLQWRSRSPWTFRLVKSEVKNGIAQLTINRPDAMNALNEAVVAQLHEAFNEAASDPSVKGIVLAGSGKAFVAGADIRFFVRNIDSGDLDRIVQFTKAGHDLLDSIDRCEKPVVARLHGLALGGGVELALACDTLIATPRASFAFPETGIGIYPGLGGTQRAARRVGGGLARWLIFTGQTLSAEEAASIGFIDRVVSPDALDGAVREAVAAGIKPHPRPPLSDRHAAIERLFAGADPDALRAGSVETGSDETLVKAVKRVGSKAPIALRLSARLIDAGLNVPLADGLKLELDHLKEIFSTKDAYEGLSSLGKRPPVFEGR